MSGGCRCCFFSLSLNSQGGKHTVLESLQIRTCQWIRGSEFLQREFKRCLAGLAEIDVREGDAAGRHVRDVGQRSRRGGAGDAVLDGGVDALDFCWERRVADDEAGVGLAGQDVGGGEGEGDGEEREGWEDVGVHFDGVFMCV